MTTVKEGPARHKQHLPMRRHHRIIRRVEPDDGKMQRLGWKRALSFAFTAIAVLAALIAVRGPDAVGSSAVEMVGAWKLSGPAFWHPLTVFSVIAHPAYWALGPRGWQNIHVIIAWVTLLCWLVRLPDRAWRGLAPLVPALLAVVLSGPASGLAGFGLAVMVLSAARIAVGRNNPRAAVAAIPIGALLAAWLSPGALPVIAAVLLDSVHRLGRRRFVSAALMTLIALQFTPRGFAVWSDAWVFLRWSPQPELSAEALTALLLNLAVLALAWRALARGGSPWAPLAPALLFLCSAEGQGAFLWPAALFMIPCWDEAKEQIRRTGLNIRWWVQTTLLLGAAALAAAAAVRALPRWYSLAMTDSVIVPTLTRQSAANGPVYINPQGRPLARFAGPLPPEAGDGKIVARLAREPSLWREQDRRARYRTVWLLGEKSDYAPLARHLGESPDWNLTAVDATGVVFTRAPRADDFATEPARQAAREMWGGANKSSYLSGAALACLAAGAVPEADELSSAAVNSSDHSAAAAAARALVLVSTAKIREALAMADLATSLDPALPEAWEARTEVQLRAGKTDDAYASSRRLLELSPGNTGALWLAARAANAARAYQSEAEILEELVALTEGHGGDASFYNLYLGQSYAKQGLGRPALRAFEKAAAAPGLSDKQRADIRGEIERVRAAADRL